MSALEVGATAVAAYEALREKQGVVYGDEAAALADQQHAALRGLIAELRLYHEHAGLTFPALLSRGPITDEMVEAARDAYADKQGSQRRDQIGRLPNTLAGRTENARARMRAAIEAAEAAQ